MRRCALPPLPRFQCSLFGFHAAVEVDDGCQDTGGVCGVRGVCAWGSGFITSPVLAMFSVLHNSFLCLFLLTGGCGTSSPCGVSTVLVQSSQPSSLV